jgi:hypothetical protein
LFASRGDGVRGDATVLAQVQVQAMCVADAPDRAIRRRTVGGD